MRSSVAVAGSTFDHFPCLSVSKPVSIDPLFLRPIQLCKQLAELCADLRSYRNEFAVLDEVKSGRPHPDQPVLLRVRFHAVAVLAFNGDA